MSLDDIFGGYIPGEKVQNIPLSDELGPSSVAVCDDISLKQSELFPDLLNNKDKKADNGAAENKTTAEGGESSPDTKTDEYKALEIRASRSQLMKHIQQDELNRLKIEAELVNFKKVAGEVAEFRFMETLYISYLES